jgi:hypothetical protein
MNYLQYILFYYKRGKFETNVMWKRPTYDSIKSFLIDLQENTDIFKKYNLTILGKVLLDITDTWDVDIHLWNIDGSQDIPVDLEKDMNIVYDYGISRNRILPDICWVDRKLDSISKVDYMSGNYDEFKHKRIKTTNVTKIVNNTTLINTTGPEDERTVFLNKDLVLIKDSVWPGFNDISFKTNAKFKVEDYFILENQIHFYNGLDFINSTSESFFGETNPLYGKSSKII